MKMKSLKGTRPSKAAAKLPLTMVAEPLPLRMFDPHALPYGILAEGNLRVHPRGRLRAKLFVFETPAKLRAFWREEMGINLGRTCLGAVTQLREVVYDPPGKMRNGEWIGRGEPVSQRVDPRFFCVIGLAVGEHLRMEILCHESVHAGFAYYQRTQRMEWNIGDGSLDEEWIAYPTGAIAREINFFLHERKLYR